MVLAWLAFALILFVIEPLLQHRRMEALPQAPPDFARMELVHRMLLVSSLVTGLGAVAGGHGWSF